MSLFGCNQNVESKGYFGVFSRGINFLLGKIICALGTVLLGVAFGCCVNKFMPGYNKSRMGWGVPPGFQNCFEVFFLLKLL